jgi:hypothetical protein
MVPLGTSFLALPISEGIHIYELYWKHHWKSIFLFAAIPSFLAFLFTINLVGGSVPCVPLFSTSTVRSLEGRRNSRRRLLDRFLTFFQNAGAAIIRPRNLLLALSFWAVHMTFAPNPGIFGTEDNMTFTYVPRFLYFIYVDLSSTFEDFHLCIFIPYALAVLVTIIMAKISDHKRVRSTFILFWVAVSSACFTIIIIASASGWSTWILYLASVPITSGYFALTTLIITWTMDNEKTDIGRLVVVSVFAVVEEVGTQLSPNGVFPYFRTPFEWTDPLQIRVHMIDIGMMGLVAATTLWLRRYLVKENESICASSSSLEPRLREGKLTGIYVI